MPWRSNGLRRPRFSAVRSNRVLARLWYFTDYSFVFFMRSNPEPNNFVAVKNANSSMSFPDTRRINRLGWMNFFEAKTWMIGIDLKMSVSFTSLLLHPLGKLLETVTKARRYVRLHSWSGLSGFVRPFRCSLSASSASCANWAGERAKASSHRRSDSNSASSHLASLSCSFFGSLTASAKAFSRSLVITASLPAPARCSNRTNGLPLSRRVFQRSAPAACQAARVCILLLFPVLCLFLITR
jgi:hypothetical protein